VLLAPIAEQPIHALVAPSGDSILLSQDTKVSTLANIPDMIESEFGTYDEFLIEHRDQFMLFNQVASDLDPDLIFQKVIRMAAEGFYRREVDGTPYFDFSDEKFMFKRTWQVVF
jgi:hypothetical protein